MAEFIVVSTLAIGFVVGAVTEAGRIRTEALGGIAAATRLRNSQPWPQPQRARLAFEYLVGPQEPVRLSSAQVTGLAVVGTVILLAVFAWPVAVLLRVFRDAREEEQGRIARQDEVRAHWLARYLPNDTEPSKSNDGET